MLLNNISFLVSGGGLLSGFCLHGVTYGQKYLIRGEGARDHVDLQRCIKVPSTIAITDIANLIAKFGNRQFPGMNNKIGTNIHKGRTLEFGTFEQTINLNKQ